MRIPVVLTGLAAMLLSVPAAAQDAPGDEQLVLDTVSGFMTAFDARDAEGMTTLLAENAMLAKIQEREGQDGSGSMLLSWFASYIAGASFEATEPLDIRAVMVEGPVAMVWSDYGFYMDGELSHCGVNIFTLMRVDDEWKIASITYSHIEEPCEDAPRP